MYRLRGFFRILLGALLAPLLILFYPHVSDWHLFYEIANFQPPSKGYHNPVWTQYLLSPLSLFDSMIAYGIFMGITISYTTYQSKRWSNSYIPAILALISPPFMRNLIHGQIELMPLIGVFTESIILSPFFILIKPQSAIGVVWAKVRRNIGYAIIFIPLAIIAYLTMDFANLNVSNQNISLFPYTIPLGLYFLLKSIKDRNILDGVISTPFLMPYLITHSLFVPLFCFNLRYPKLSIITWILLWILFTYQ